MDTMTRNHIFMENIDLINRTLRRHRLLLYALHLELDDVYQELAIAALQAIDTYDDRRCDSITVHIWAKLQYAVLTIKRRNKPHGIMACEGFAPGVLSLELSEDYGYPAVAETGSDDDLIRERRLRQALARLEPQERRAVLDYLDGMKPHGDLRRTVLTPRWKNCATSISAHTERPGLGCKIGGIST